MGFRMPGKTMKEKINIFVPYFFRRWKYFFKEKMKDEMYADNI